MKRVVFFRYMLLMSSMIVLSSSSFFLSDYLTKKITTGDYRLSQLNYAIGIDNVAALTIAQGLSEYGSKDWLALNQRLAATQAMSALRLARWYQRQAQAEPSSQHINTAIMWFEQAIRHKSQMAIEELARLYYTQGSLDKARELLGQITSQQPITPADIKAILLAIKIAVHQGNISQVKHNIDNLYAAQLTDNLDVKAILHDLTLFNVLSLKPEVLKITAVPTEKSVVGQSTCIADIQMLATNLAHLKHLQALITAFNHSQTLASLFCFPTPKYVSIKDINCLHAQEKPITCDEAMWAKRANTIETRYLGLMLDEGGANVHLGILYIDAQDDVNVLSHELSHLLGFVDEYPLIAGHVKCKKAQESAFSHNIVVLNSDYQGDRVKVRDKILAQIPWAGLIKPSTPILHAIEQGEEGMSRWQLGTPNGFSHEVGVFTSETCDNSSQKNTEPANRDRGQQGSAYNAYKPVSKFTQLRYNANKFPEEYFAMVKQHPQRYLMPSFEYNIALALFNHGEIAEAKAWLAKAAKWERQATRKVKVINGDY